VNSCISCAGVHSQKNRKVKSIKEVAMKKLEYILITFLSLIMTLQVMAQEDPIFFIVEEMPEFPGGENAMKKYIADNVNYPEEAMKNNIEGKVYVTFVVSKEGSVEDAQIARGVSPALDKEALRVINSLPNWTPGKQRGKNVNVKYTVPIQFKLSGESGLDKDAETEEVVFHVVEEMPEFPGGEKALREYVTENIEYPEAAKENGIQGKVYITFTVAKDGSIKNAKVARGVDPSLDKEALRVINSMPAWNPGKQRGEKVDVQYTVPVNFALDNDEKEPNKN
jgi:TonB family protein